MNILAAAMTLLGITFFFLLNRSANKIKNKVNTLAKAGYQKRDAYTPAGGFGDIHEEEFFVNGEWIDLETAYKHFQNS